MIAFAERLGYLAEADAITMPQDYELYITVNKDSTGQKGRYYYVDHTTQAVFWLEEIDPERHGLNLAPVCSIAHMSTCPQDPEDVATQRAEGETFSGR